MSARLLFAALLASLTLAGCDNAPRTQMPAMAGNGGDPRHGAALIRQFGCGACHTIPGIRGAKGKVAPPLDFFSRRSFIAGELANTPANLERWLENPPAIEPKTAMPALGLDADQARDIAAYLLTLR